VSELELKYNYLTPPPSPILITKIKIIIKYIYNILQPTTQRNEEEEEENTHTHQPSNRIN
jgi:hypothetical protein